MKLENQEQAIEFILANVKPQLEEFWKSINADFELGSSVEILQTNEVHGHKAWCYHIEGMMLSRDGRATWLLDDGTLLETFSTSKDLSTLKQAYSKHKLQQ